MTNRERKREAFRAWYAANREERLPKMRAYWKRHQFWVRYQLTPEDLAILRKRQRGVCAMCHRRRRLQVDHDHAIGDVREAVRALVCGSCNGLVYSRVEKIGLANLLRHANPTACSPGWARQVVQYLKAAA